MTTTDLPHRTTPIGRLDWRVLLKWLRDDKVISPDDAEVTRKRFSGADSAQHPLVRLGSAGLTRMGSGKILDTEALTEWLAGRCGLPYMRIDPLKVDVGRVAEVMLSRARRVGRKMVRSLSQNGPWRGQSRISVPSMMRSARTSRNFPCGAMV